MIRWFSIIAISLLLNSVYLSALPSATIFYMANVLLHLALGAGFLVLLRLRGWMWPGLPIFLSVLPALYLIRYGAIRDHRMWLWAHIALAVAGTVTLWLHARKQQPQLARWMFLSLVLLAVVPGGMKLLEKPSLVANASETPSSMEEEGDGPKSPFWPSSAKTNVGLVPSSYFLDSEQCGTCHKDIYEQWKSSVHHFASFNNQFYRKSIEFMQEKQGSTKPSRWCAACHDHAVIFNGKWETPIKDQIDTPEAKAGLACVSCHSIVHVKDTMGNAGFTLDYNWLHVIAANRNPYVQSFDKFLTYLNPRPHRQTFLKPLHQTPEFCSSCHKVHLDVPVNNYRWMRGFNDYDNWQASGVSGRGARSFYYPKESLDCACCHMPLIASHDPGNRNGKVHSHRFPAANTAVAHVNKDQAQFEVTKKFLQSGFITVDIFSASPVDESSKEAKMIRRAGDASQSAMTSFAVGEEAESNAQGFLREVGKVAAPLNQSGAKFQPGSTARVDVVVRTRRIGHFFPAGTVDAFDVWLELEGKDATGKHIFWSGRAEGNGSGPVEPGAHFYRSYQLDGEGHMIDKRNAWQTRSVLYVRLIPPGAADTAHFRVQIPKDAKGPITLNAKLNYRKFAWSYTKFAFEGMEVPDIPTIVLAKAEAKMELGAESDWKQVVRAEDYERWNDWGIGMLLQGDLKGAEYAFKKVMEAKPDYADGPLNVARALIQEGETDAAKPYLQKAAQLGPTLARVMFFQAMVDKADGNYDAAIANLRKAAAQYPEDRVVLNQLGRLLFLKREYGEAVRTLDRVLKVDPEDLQAHYSLMLCHRGLGDAARSEKHAKLFQRFKADESSQALTAKQRQLSPEDNNERQMIHDHESVLLPGALRAAR